MNDVIVIENLTFSYNKTVVLEDINLNIKNSDFLAIIGPNGGGKSTLFKLMLGILPLKQGSIKRKIDIEDIGYVPQNTNLNLDFPITALEVVLMGYKNRLSFLRYSKEQIKGAIKALEMVGMGEFQDTKIGSLSGGQRQRVFIARSLVEQPKLILLDEPTASIDVKGQSEIYELLKKLNQNMAIVVISHDLSVTLGYATKVAYINKKLVYHNLEQINKKINISKNEHLCEVELLLALSENRSCGCSHV
ncbi:MAG: ABC transporter ATP-binding protein [Arcobacter butzleri]|nr:ABC transporter ATP-binding protein [Aliarcobacter butzleri]